MKAGLFGAQIDLSGPLSEVLAIVRAAKAIKACKVSVIPWVDVRCPQNRTNPSRREAYSLPMIAQGKCMKALEHLERLVNQARLTPEEGAEARKTLRELAELTNGLTSSRWME